jgi:hypothetical protein
MSKKKTPGDYEVGYGKPPEATQFKKGRSGNSKGRPKKAPDFDTEFLRESKALITINDNGKRRSISKLQGIVKQLHNKALTGNISAARICFTIKQPRGLLCRQPNNLAERKIPTTSRTTQRKNWRGCYGRL